jgi:hypothetical protein
VPASVDNMAKIKCVSLFSEWLGRIIEAPHTLGFKMVIVALGVFAVGAVLSTFTSFRGSALNVSYVGVTNPAAISHTNMNKLPGSHPILD